MKTVSVENERLLLDSTLKVKEGQIIRSSEKDTVQRFTRQKVERVDAAVVLVYHREFEKVILTRQFRYPVFHREEEFLLEIVAGKVDPGETPLETAFRETEEEIGYRVLPEKMYHWFSFYASPGYTTEQYHLYYAEVSETDKVNEGGGLANEFEQIELVWYSKSEFFSLVEQGKIKDAKTLVAALRWKLL